MDGKYQLNYRTTFESGGTVELQQLELSFKPGPRTNPILLLAATQPSSITDTSQADDRSVRVAPSFAAVTRFVSQVAETGDYLVSFENDNESRDELRRLLAELLNDLKLLFEELQQSLDALGEVSAQMANSVRSEMGFDALGISWSTPATIAELAESLARAQQFRDMLRDAWADLAQPASSQTEAGDISQHQENATDNIAEQTESGVNSSSAEALQRPSAILSGDDDESPQEVASDTAGID